MLMANETQPYILHSKYVASTARDMADRELVEKNPAKRKLILDYIYYAALLHDLGKVIPEFQEWLKATPEERKKMVFSAVYHEIYSYHIVKEVTDNHLILNPILWHHSLRGSQMDKTKAPALTQEILDLVFKEGGVFDQLEEGLVETLQALEEQIILTGLRNKKNNSDAGQLFSFMGTPESSMNNKAYIKQINNYNTSRKELLNSIKDNALTDIIKVFVITADRIVSSVGTDWDLIPERVEAFYNQTFPFEADAYLESFDRTSERGINQANAVEGMMVRDDQAVVSGPAGCGKTWIALEWHKKNGGAEGKPLYFVCPRLSVIEGVAGELRKHKVPHSIWTGSQKDPINTNIVIISLDQILNAVKTHTKDEHGREVTELAMTLANGNVVFDEFHENFEIPGLDLLFVELAMVCAMFKSNKTAYVSASPNPYILNYFMPHLRTKGSSNYSESFRSVVTGNSDYIVKMPTHNHKDYRIDFVDEMPKNVDPNTIVIYNTVEPAIGDYYNHGGMLVHGRYEKKYYSDMIKGVFKKFGKPSEVEGPRDEVMFASPQVQCSLNITCATLITEFTTPENFIQRIGRAGRFCENELTVIKLVKKGSQSLNLSKSLKRSEEFYDVLKKNFENRVFKLNELQEFYYDYYESYSGDEDFTARLNQSLKVVNLGVFNPRRSASKKDDDKKEEVMILPYGTARGQSRFVTFKVLTEDLKETGRTVLMTLDVKKLTADHKGESFVSLNTCGKTEKVTLHDARSEEHPIDCSVDRPWGLFYVENVGYTSKRQIDKLRKEMKK